MPAPWVDPHINEHGVEIWDNAPMVCVDCPFFEDREFDYDGYLWAEAFCHRGLKFPTRKGTCAVKENTAHRVSRVTPVEERFWSKVDKGGANGCWNWLGSLNDWGYGNFSFRKKWQRAHRVSWMLAHGDEPPANLMVLHKCDNPACVNPEHLFLGTHNENMRDMSQKHRYKLPDIHGEAHHNAKLTDDKVRTIRQLYADKKFVQLELAEMFGVSLNAIHEVIHLKTWRHVK